MEEARRSPNNLDEVVVEALRRFDAGEDPADIIADYPRYEGELLGIFQGSSKYHQTGRQLRQTDESLN